MDEFLELVFGVPLQMINSLYTKSYYGKGFRCPDIKIDDLKDERTLIISTYLDNETVGLGGTLFKSENFKSEKSIIYIANEYKENKKLDKAEFKRIRDKEAYKIKDIYRIKDIYFMDIDQGKVNSEDTQTVDRIVDILKEKKPERIYTPFLFSGNKDHMEATRMLIRALEIYDKDFKNIWMYEITTPNDLRIINRVTNLDRETYSRKKEVYKEFELKKYRDFEIHNFMDKQKASLLENVKAYGAETFIRLSLTSVKAVEEMLLNTGFEPEHVGKLTSQLDLLPAFLKDKSRRMKYNNNLNYVLKGRFIQSKEE